MDAKRILALLLFLAPMLHSQAQVQGGDINWVDVQASQSPVWYGILGRVSPEKAQPLVLEAAPGSLASITINTSESECSGPADSLDIVFSTAQGTARSLSPGDVALLDRQISDPSQGGNRTFLETSAFSTGIWGTIPDVPTVYLNSQTDKRAFRMGFLQDQDGNFVFISEVNKNQAGFDGSVADFEAMLPAIGGKVTEYFAQADLKCTRNAASSGTAVPQPQDSGQANSLLANQLVDLRTGAQQASGGNSGTPVAGAGTQQDAASGKTSAAQAASSDGTTASPDIAASFSDPSFLSSLVSKLIWFGAGFAVVVVVAVGGFLITRRRE